MASYLEQPGSQKCKTILDFNEARDHGVAAASAGPYANQMHYDQNRQYTTSLIFFYEPNALSATCGGYN